MPTIFISTLNNVMLSDSEASLPRCARLFAPLRVTNKKTPTIFIPTPLRELTGGKGSVVLSASSVCEAIQSLEAGFPGIRDRLCEGEKVRPNISVFVDGQVSHLKMREKLSEESEVHFVIAVSGG